ncbi:MAG: transposase [Ethanoligenens sp.]
MEYPSDLTDSQWERIRKFFEGKNRGKHLCKHRKRELMNGVLHVVKTGCQWRQLPHDFPLYTTVWNFYRRARIKGLWDKILAELVKTSRVAAGRGEMPSYALVDSQSVKTTGAADERGIDGGKKQTGESGTS